LSRNAYQYSSNEDIGEFYQRFVSTYEVILVNGLYLVTVAELPDGIGCDAEAQDYSERLNAKEERQLAQLLLRKLNHTRYGNMLSDLQ
jgi:hypothetical protein